MDEASPLPYRIVLIEDAEPDVFLVREALETHHLDVDLLVLEDGEKAVEYIERLERDGAERLPRLCLLDLNLPRKSGSQVLERLRQSPRCGQIPVVILTSSDSPQDRARASQFQITEYFRKPSRLEEFMKLGGLVGRLLANPSGAGE